MLVKIIKSNEAEELENWINAFLRKEGIITSATFYYSTTSYIGVHETSEIPLMMYSVLITYPES